ncbi:MAG: hypothetical protein ACXAEX_05165 [Promethearchaeota archaeon]|jgi:hypothetical protein
MGEEDSYNSDIESELYALVHLILNAHEKFEEGIINDNFFRKTVRNGINELLKFNFHLDDKKIDLSQLLIKMNFTDQYYKVIKIINKLSSLEFSEKSSNADLYNESPRSKGMGSIVLELPSITLEITSSFITLMDALKLKGLKENELIGNLFRELIKNMKKFPGIDDLLNKVNAIYKRTLTYNDIEGRTNKFDEIIVDELYQIFREFQHKLNRRQ